MTTDEGNTGSYFVANVRQLRWQENELGASCEFDKHRERFAEFGINLTVLKPGQPMAMYHRERYQEGFLVLRGECLLIVEGQEMQLQQWDYFHCPRPSLPATTSARGVRSSCRDRLS
jgi:quercetin dioxygenase-like cupin family protein